MCDRVSREIGSFGRTRQQYQVEAFASLQFGG
jgi:hypothetical protein